MTTEQAAQPLKALHNIEWAVCVCAIAAIYFVVIHFIKKP